MEPRNLGFNQNLFVCSRNFVQIQNFASQPDVSNLKIKTFASQPVRAWVWQRVRLCWPWPPLLLHWRIFLCLWRKYLYLWEECSRKYWINMSWNWLFNTQTKVNVLSWVPVLFLWRVFSCFWRKYMRRMIQQTLNKQDPVSATQKTCLANYFLFLVWFRLFLIAKCLVIEGLIIIILWTTSWSPKLLSSADTFIPSLILCDARTLRFLIEKFRCWRTKMPINDDQRPLS